MNRDQVTLAISPTLAVDLLPEGADTETHAQLRQLARGLRAELRGRGVRVRVSGDTDADQTSASTGRIVLTLRAGTYPGAPHRPAVLHAQVPAASSRELAARISARLAMATGQVWPALPLPGALSVTRGKPAAAALLYLGDPPAWLASKVERLAPVLAEALREALSGLGTTAEPPGEGAPEALSPAATGSGPVITSGQPSPENPPAHEADESAPVPAAHRALPNDVPEPGAAPEPPTPSEPAPAETTTTAAEASPAPVLQEAPPEVDPAPAGDAPPGDADTRGGPVGALEGQPQAPDPRTADHSAPLAAGTEWTPEPPAAPEPATVETTTALGAGPTCSPAPAPRDTPPEVDTTPAGNASPPTETAPARPDEAREDEAPGPEPAGDAPPRAAEPEVAPETPAAPEPARVEATSPSGAGIQVAPRSGEPATRPVQDSTCEADGSVSMDLALPPKAVGEAGVDTAMWHAAPDLGADGSPDDAAAAAPTPLEEMEPSRAPTAGAATTAQATAVAAGSTPNEDRAPMAEALPAPERTGARVPAAGREPDPLPAAVPAQQGGEPPSPESSAPSADPA